MSAGHGASASILKQPKAVWAVAFASVIAFMGIGLVDPILPAIAAGLEATPTETEMLFTSYLLVTGFAMLATSWVSSRIGAKRTLADRPRHHRGVRCRRRALAERRVDHRLPRGMGPRQRALHLDGARHDRRRRRGRIGRGDHPLRGRAGPRHRDRPAARRAARAPQLARSVLRHRHPHGDRARRDPRAHEGRDGCRGRHASLGHRCRRGIRCIEARADAPLRPPSGTSPARARRARGGRAVLQHRVLRAAGLLAVPARIRRARTRLHVLRLGRRARDHLGLRGPDPDGTDAAHPRALDRAAVARGHPRGGGLRPSDRPGGSSSASWPAAWCSAC